MTSKEALKLLETRCRFYAQDNDELQETYEAREKIEKDLAILEILKNYSDYYTCTDTYGYGESCLNIVIHDDIKEYTIIKEWLEHE